LGETTSVGPQAHQADGYSSVTHELAHLVHDALPTEDRAWIDTVWENKRARGGSVSWPDGVRLELPDGEGVDNYSSTSADEYFAQLSNAYLGTNLGTDAATGLARNNGAAYVRLHERELLPLLERLYGTDPEAVYGGPANPVTATAADDARYDAFRDAMALEEDGGTPQEPAPVAGTRPADGARGASGVVAGPPLDHFRSSTYMLGSFVAARDFTSSRGPVQVDAVPRTHQLLGRPDWLDGPEHYTPVGEPRDLMWQSAHVVHARLAPGFQDRIEVTEEGSDEVRQLAFDEFARLVASDPYLARVHAGLPVVLLVPDALSRNLELLRAVRDAAGRPVWGHTGRVVLFEETPGGAPEIGVLKDTGRVVGQWLFLPAESRGREPEPSEPLWTVDGELIDGEDLVLHPFAHPDGRFAGHWSMAERERSGRREEGLYAVADGVESAHYEDLPEDGENTGSEPVAWSGTNPYFLNAHGRPGAVTLMTTDGDRARFSGEHAGRLLRQRRSFVELVPADSPVVALVCRAAASPSAGTTTFAQELADASGHAVFGAPTNVLFTRLDPPLAVANDERTGEPGTWRVAVPGARHEVFDRFVRESGLVGDGAAVTDDDRMWMFQVLRMERDFHGAGATDPLRIRRLATLAGLYRAATPSTHRAAPLSKGLLQNLARVAFRFDASRTVTDGDVAHLLDLVGEHGPATQKALFGLARVNPPASPPGDSAQSGSSRAGGSRPGTGVRGAPPGTAETSLSLAEARRLAAAAVEADASKLAAMGGYVRNPQNENQITDQVAQRLREIVPQAQAARPFAPTAELARLFVGFDANLRGAVQPDVLPYLVLDRPDVLAWVGESGRIRTVTLTIPGFAQFLGSYPNLLSELVAVESLPPMAEHVPFLMQYQDVARALETDARLRQTVVREIGLVKGLGGKLSLIRAVAESLRVSNAVASVPRLAEVLRTSASPMAAIRTLRNNLSLTMAVHGYPVDTQQLKAVLGSAGLVRAMYRYPQQLATVFRVPELLAAVQ
ncbi:hypothetical protein, partial [Streptomyces sp. NPDC001770]